MKTITNPAKMTGFIKDAKAKGKTVGFVPTMGYLHDGHMALIRNARKENDIVVMSIFVNPAQFGPKEDYAKYPRDFKRDSRLAKKQGVDVIFHPAVKTMYLPEHSAYVTVENLATNLCGRSRPGHFRGVATIVTKLFNIVPADNAYFGQKDAQQAFIVKRMARDLNIPVKIKIVPTVREKDGLAMSSRNVYLSGNERREAGALFKSLSLAEKLIKQGERNSKKITKAIKGFIAKNSSAKIDYVSIVDTEELRNIGRLSGRILIAIAVYFGKTRLIDNVILDV
ncbi:MAG: pantoate--beta-alanine ligase [Candidatus Omnitrophica bacterium]|nr:pantoate--beta-alanine ligase [Candidatus Omnitrophota bacterium]